MRLALLVFALGGCISAPDPLEVLEDQDAAEGGGDAAPGVGNLTLCARGDIELPAIEDLVAGVSLEGAGDARDLFVTTANRGCRVVGFDGVSGTASAACQSVLGEGSGFQPESLAGVGRRALVTNVSCDVAGEDDVQIFAPDVSDSGCVPWARPGTPGPLLAAGRWRVDSGSDPEDIVVVEHGGTQVHYAELDGSSNNNVGSGSGEVLSVHMIPDIAGDRLFVIRAGDGFSDDLHSCVHGQECAEAFACDACQDADQIAISPSDSATSRNRLAIRDGNRIVLTQFNGSTFTAPVELSGVNAGATWQGWVSWGTCAGSKVTAGDGQSDDLVVVSQLPMGLRIQIFYDVFSAGTECDNSLDLEVPGKAFVVGAPYQLWVVESDGSYYRVALDLGGRCG